MANNTHGVVRIEEGDLVILRQRRQLWKQRLPKQRDIVYR